MSDTVLTALIAAGIPALVTIISAVVQHRSKRLTNMMKKNCDHMDKRLDELNHKCDENRRETLRDRLQMMILLDSENKDTILTIAKTYFIDMKGNGESWANFHAWAKKHKIDTKWYEQLLAREEGKL